MGALSTQYDGLVLVLDHSYAAIDRKPWQEVMVDWANGKVEVVATYDNRIIHHGLQLLMPSVVRFTTPVTGRARKVKFSRENIYARDRGRCQYCFVDVALRDATYDHVIPRVNGGRTEWTNIVIACQPCNRRKGGRSPEQAGMHLHHVPMRPRSLPPRANPKLLWQNDMPEDWRPWLHESPVGTLLQWR